MKRGRTGLIYPGLYRTGTGFTASCRLCSPLLQLLPELSTRLHQPINSKEIYEALAKLPDVAAITAEQPRAGANHVDTYGTRLFILYVIRKGLEAKSKLCKPKQSGKIKSNGL